MKTVAELVEEQGVFQGLKPEWIELMSGCGKNIRLEAKTFLFREGQPADHFYLLRRGKVALEIDVPGQPPAVFQTLGPGEVLGWSWLFPPYQYAYDAQVQEELGAIAFDGKCLRGKCEANTDFGYALMKRFSKVFFERLKATRLQVLDIYGGR